MTLKLRLKKDSQNTCSDCYRGVKPYMNIWFSVLQKLHNQVTQVVSARVHCPPTKYIKLYISIIKYERGAAGALEVLQ